MPQTLYLKNLPSTPRANKLKRILCEYLSGKGISPLRLRLSHGRTRGFAWISFTTEKDANDAFRLLDGRIVGNKRIKVAWADHEMDWIKWGDILQLELEEKKQLQQSGTTEKPAIRETVGNTEGETTINYVELPKQLLQLRKERSLRRETIEKSTSKSNSKANSKDEIIPNKILLLTDLPDGASQETIEQVFGSFTGFLNLTLVAMRNLALVEFKTENDAVICLSELGKNLKISEKSTNLTFAKK
ncbi:hypothetical protein DAMA08_009010 [Martiniozyma asiatica (nom. inval.)]|nr:hypothetical protein DAMA08_009010 [Martiniozyma asiatica]